MYICKRDFFIQTAKEEDAKKIAGLYKCSLENLMHRKGLEESILKIITNRSGLSETKCYTITDSYKSVIGTVFVKHLENSLEIQIWIPNKEDYFKEEIKQSIIDCYKSSGYYLIISKIIILKENLEKPFSFKGYVENTNIILKNVA